MAEKVTQSIIVKGRADDIFRLWADFENFPNFMAPLKSVQKTGERTSHWVAESPTGETLEWDAETTMLEPGRRIGWNSKDGGDIKTSGQVTFTELPQEQTQVTVTLQYVPGGGVARKIADKMFVDQEKQLLENLRSFKLYAEEQYKEAR